MNEDKYFTYEFLKREILAEYQRGEITREDYEQAIQRLAERLGL